MGGALISCSTATDVPQSIMLIFRSWKALLRSHTSRCNIWDFHIYVNNEASSVELRRGRTRARTRAKPPHLQYIHCLTLYRFTSTCESDRTVLFQIEVLCVTLTISGSQNATSLKWNQMVIWRRASMTIAFIHLTAICSTCCKPGVASVSWPEAITRLPAPDECLRYWSKVLSSHE